jgi:hypothetical protein
VEFAGPGNCRGIKDVLTIEQPCADQKFSAQEFLKALRSAEKNETILPSARAARKEARLEADTRKKVGKPRWSRVLRLTRRRIMTEQATTGNCQLLQFWNQLHVIHKG